VDLAANSTISEMYRRLCVFALQERALLVLGGAARILDLAPIWGVVYVPIVVLAAAGVALSATNFVRPVWTPARSVARLAIDAGILLGLSRDVSTELLIQTMVGSAKMLRDSGRHPVELRDAVTSPGGTTIAAVRVLEQERVRAAFLNAIEAAKQRSQELAGS
jgi:hypothetical protein